MRVFESFPSEPHETEDAVGWLRLRFRSVGAKGCSGKPATKEALRSPLRVELYAIDTVMSQSAPQANPVQFSTSAMLTLGGGLSCAVVNSSTTFASETPVNRVGEECQVCMGRVGRPRPPPSGGGPPGAPPPARAGGGGGGGGGGRAWRWPL